LNIVRSFADRTLSRIEVVEEEGEEKKRMTSVDVIKQTSLQERFVTQS